MIETAPRVSVLRQQIIDEAIKALRLRPNAWTRAAIGLALSRPAHRFSQIAAEFDRRVSAVGLVEAARWALEVFRTQLQVSFGGPVPKEGPLLIATNHPGSVDGLAVAASVGRADLKMVVSGLPFLRSLPHAARHLIYVTLDPHQRMGVVRGMVRHLRQGGAVLIFPSGRVDPDPDVLPGAEEALSSWSPSTGVVLRALPETKVLTGVVSGVLSAVHLRSPIVRLGRELRQRQLLAEWLQMIRLMMVEAGESITARLTLSEPVAGAELAASGQGAREITQALIQKARALLSEHLSSARRAAKSEPGPRCAEAGLAGFIRSGLPSPGNGDQSGRARGEPMHPAG